MDCRVAIVCAFDCGTCGTECSVTGASFNEADDFIITGWCRTCMVEKTVRYTPELRAKLKGDVPPGAEQLVLADFAPMMQ